MKIVITDNAFKDRAKKWSRVMGNNWRENIVKGKCF